MHTSNHDVQALKRPAPQNGSYESVARTISMTSLELVEFINIHRDRHADATGTDFVLLMHKSFLAKVPEVLGEETSAKFLADLPDSYGRPRKGYSFPKRESCLMAMSYSYELQAAVFDHMTALEAKIAQPLSLPSYAETLRLYADQIEQTQRITHQRDEAVATKAEIGSRREATAMATASAAVKRARQLEGELGRNSLHATIISVEKATGQDFGKQGFRPLQKWCKSRSITSQKVPCPRYGEAAAWPAAAWADCYGINLADLFGGGV
jgi:hypothetical protein